MSNTENADPIDSADDEAEAAAPKKRRKSKRLTAVPAAVDLDDGGDADDAWPDERPAIVHATKAPQLVRMTSDDVEEDARDTNEPRPAAPKRARRRPNATHVSTPPRPADDEEEADVTNPEAPAAKKKTPAKKKPTKAVKVDRFAHLPFEIAGIVLFALALIATFALLSYSAADATATGKAVKNWVGPGGAVLADLLTLGFGFGAFLFPFALGFAGFACFRPIKQGKRAALRVVGAVVGGSSFLALCHLLFRGTSFLPFPAGGLWGALLADSGSQFLAPLGTGIMALTFTTVGSLIALDRPIGPVVLAFGEKLRAMAQNAKERLELWREERRVLLEESERLNAELDAEAAANADDDSDDGEAKAAARAERKKRIYEEAEKRAKKRLSDRRDAQSAFAPASLPPAEAKPVLPEVAGIEPKAAAADDNAKTLVQNASDPPWAKQDLGPALEPKVDGKVISLQKVLGAAAAVEDEPAIEDDGAAFRIIERQVVDAAAVADAAAPVVEEPEREIQLPPLNLLDYDAPNIEPIDPEKLRAQAEKLILKFRDFGIEGRVREVRPGPVCTTYEFVPAPGIKVSKIAALADDIAMAMEAIHVRIVAPIPGKGAVGIEIPNEKRETVYMKEIIADPAFMKRSEKLMMALGKDIEGRPYYANLAEMPHVLISGTTGSGKSVSVNAMICSILYRATPEDVRFLMIDPKMLELSVYDGIPHLLLPPIIDTKKAAVALKWAVNEMERRYQLMSELGVRDLAGFNQKIVDIKEGKDPEAKTKLLEALEGKPIEKFPFIVIVVDEYADLLATAGKDVEGYVMRLAQKARAAGMHVMLATQRPSVDVITGVIKANFPVRMGFRLASSHDSKTIINRPGAEKLLGRGDMLFMPPGTSNVLRVHGAFISEKELHKVVGFLKEQKKPNYDMSILTTPMEAEGEAGGMEVDEPKDTRYDEAVAVVARTRKCSTSWLQRMMNLGYQRAARIVDRMEREGLVGPAQNAKGDRDIFVKPEDVPGRPAQG